MFYEKQRVWFKATLLWQAVIIFLMRRQQWGCIRWLYWLCFLIELIGLQIWRQNADRGHAQHCYLSCTQSDLKMQDNRGQRCNRRRHQWKVVSVALAGGPFTWLELVLFVVEKMLYALCLNAQDLQETWNASKIQKKQHPSIQRWWWWATRGKYWWVEIKWNTICSPFSLSFIFSTH